MMRKYAISVVATLVVLLSGIAECSQIEEARALFYGGNNYYSEENYKEAIASYKGALERGFASGNLYYNLANAHFKNASLGLSIANYLRAERLMPKDADLNANLTYARSLIKGGQLSSQRNWFGRLFFSMANAFNVNSLTLYTSILFFTLVLLCILYLLIKNMRWLLVYLRFVALAAFLFSGALCVGQFYNSVVWKHAVVRVEYSDSKFEPIDDATTFFTLREGESVTIEAQSEDWVKVKRLDGKQGWIKEKDLELL